MNKSIVITAAISAVVGGIAGGAITFVTVNKKLKERYALEAESQIADVKRHYALLANGQETKKSVLERFPTDISEEDYEEARQVAERIINNLYASGSDELKPVELPKAEKTSKIWDHAVQVNDDGEVIDPEDDDEPSELPEIDPDYEIIEGEPYLITEAEFFENEDDYEMDTLTYYEVDDTLCDEKNSQIEDVEGCVGARHLTMFNTEGSKGKTSLYIKNDDHKSLYEVILVNESYASVVLGMSDEDLGLKEPKRRPKKMRDED